MRWWSWARGRRRSRRAAAAASGCANSDPAHARPRRRHATVRARPLSTLDELPSPTSARSTRAMTPAAPGTPSSSCTCARRAHAPHRRVLGSGWAGCRARDRAAARALTDWMGFPRAVDLGATGRALLRRIGGVATSRWCAAASTPTRKATRRDEGADAGTARLRLRHPSCRPTPPAASALRAARRLMLSPTTSTCRSSRPGGRDGPGALRGHGRCLRCPPSRPRARRRGRGGAAAPGRLPLVPGAPVRDGGRGSACSGGWAPTRSA